jgi:hypothetical protein
LAADVGGRGAVYQDAAVEERDAVLGADGLAAVA